MKKAQIGRLVSVLLATVGLDGFESRDARRLSGGQASRVALARSLACKPDVLLLDEPLAQTDQESRKMLAELIASLPSYGTTVVMSSHDESLPRELQCNAIRLDQGRILEVKQYSPVAANQEEGARHGFF